jgi:hypothetical protein
LRTIAGTCGAILARLARLGEQQISTRSRALGEGVQTQPREADLRQPLLPKIRGLHCGQRRFRILAGPPIGAAAEQKIEPSGRRMSDDDQVPPGASCALA